MHLDLNIEITRFAVVEITSAMCLFLETSVHLNSEQQYAVYRSAVRVLPFSEMSKINWNLSKTKTVVSLLAL